MSRHVASEHSAMLKHYNTQRAITTTTIVIHQTSKKWKKLFTTSIADFFSFVVPYKNSNPTQELFFKDLILYIIKGYRPLSSTKNVWLRRLVLCQRGRVTFPSKQ
jgi:hypothetical protein